MEGESLNPIETALQHALKHAVETDQMSAEQIIEVAELGRKHPLFDEKMARISRSPTSLAIYMAARETLPTSGLRKVADSWIEGLKLLPRWFDMVVVGLQVAPRMAYRSAALQVATPELDLVYPNPVNQSILDEKQDWKTAGAPDKVLVTVEKIEVGSEHSEVCVTVALLEDVWSLESAATYRFTVLSAADAEKAKWAEQNATESPIASALVFCSVGLFAEAEKLVVNWPSDTNLQPYVATIEHACQARRADARQLYL